MKSIKEIYEDFDRIGCLTFATVTKDGYPETRIAHLFAWDEEGLYFLTMNHKPFARQLREGGKLSICGMSSNTQSTVDEKMLPSFEAGYTMKATGDVKEVSLEEIRKKSEINPLFLTGVNDYDRYRDEIFFCLYRFWGEKYDFDFELEHRNHKLIRNYFTYGGYQKEFSGMKIDQKMCIRCGACFSRCAEYNFHAVQKTEEGYAIDTRRCDVCGNCTLVCPVGAISGY
ncbi:MAG: 4Fe-4S binding protein [Eubacterium sp.]|nr:4Fe-4S binding protein [Eubacterium sp.]